MVRGQALDIPAPTNDAPFQGAGADQVQNLGKHPTNQKEGRDWQDKITDMKGPDSAGKVLHEITLTEGGKVFGGVAASGADRGATQDAHPDGKKPGEAKSEDPNSAEIFSFLAGLQAQFKSLSGSQDTGPNADPHEKGERGEDVGRVAIIATPENYGHHAQINDVGLNRAKDVAKAEEKSTELAQTNLRFLSSQELDARAVFGDVVSTGPPPQGIDQISIFALQMRKETDGRVLLIAPRGDAEHLDFVPLVRDDGRPVSAMELGQYLRPDGTLLMGEEGRAYRPGEDFAATQTTKAHRNNGLESNSMERLPVLNQIDFASIPTGGAVDSDQTKESLNNLKKANSENLSQENLSQESVASLSLEPDHDVRKKQDEQANESNRDTTTEIASTSQNALEQMKSVTVYAGNTLRQLSLKYLGHDQNWPILAEKNNLSTETDSRGAPLVALQRGTVLTLPSTAEIADYQVRRAASLQMKQADKVST